MTKNELIEILKRVLKIEFGLAYILKLEVDEPESLVDSDQIENELKGVRRL